MKRISKYINDHEYDPIISNTKEWEKLCSIFIWYEEKDTITDKQYHWCEEYEKKHNPQPVYKTIEQLKLPYGELI